MKGELVSYSFSLTQRKLAPTSRVLGSQAIRNEILVRVPPKLKVPPRTILFAPDDGPTGSTWSGRLATILKNLCGVRRKRRTSQRSPKDLQQSLGVSGRGLCLAHGWILHIGEGLVRAFADNDATNRSGRGLLRWRCLRNKLRCDQARDKEQVGGYGFSRIPQKLKPLIRNAAKPGDVG